MASCVSCSCGFAPNSEKRSFISPIPIHIAVIMAGNTSSRNSRVCGFQVRASTVDSTSDFIRRMERAWLISQQPRPIVCSSCNSKGHIECKWCGGTGFLMLGDNMLCEIPSRNTSCLNCAGKGSMRCSDCQGTGFRAKWLEEPPTSQ